MSTLHTYNLIVCILRDVESLINVTHNPLDIVCQCYIFFLQKRQNQDRHWPKSKWVYANLFSDKRNFVRQLCDVSLLAVNISHLRVVLNGGSTNKYYIPPSDRHDKFSQSLPRFIWNLSNFDVESREAQSAMRTVTTVNTSIMYM